MSGLQRVEAGGAGVQPLRGKHVGVQLLWLPPPLHRELPTTPGCSTQAAPSYIILANCPSCQSSTMAVGGFVISSRVEEGERW